MGVTRSGCQLPGGPHGFRTLIAEAPHVEIDHPVLHILFAGGEGELLTSRFQYGRRYRERADALDVDPVSLPLAGETEFAREPVNGLPLFGAIRDAAPDAWGRRVIENRLGGTGPLPEVDYLDHAGSDRSGGLDIRTNRDSAPRESTLPASVDLPYLLEAVERIEAGEPVPAQLAHFFQGGPTMGGMRPRQ